ncbi:MAG TPA: beta-L-arabinofuranosidase domain-containing protein, partial [Vicinamibacterales bacterium]|nr:beta-L-arabinofuranosidase domain-containing protein [Vicinamibacterales bacterium]
RTFPFMGKPLRIGEWYERFYMRDPRKFDTRYAQDHLPVRQQKEAVGHAVRAMFLYCAMADLVYETNDQGLWEASKALHDSVTLRRMYVTGGIGPSAHNEGFTEDYDLPDENAYQETCASAAMVLWNQRLFNLTGNARYTDIVELSLYNAVAAGVSLTGDLFCYATPLSSRGDFRRSPWFGVPCCPTTISRFVPSIGRYVYSRSPDGLWVNQFIASEAEAEAGGGRVRLTQTGSYPWTGDVKIAVAPDAPREFTLYVRIPGWAKSHTLRVNGSDVTPPAARGYAAIRRIWKSGDIVELTLPMTVERLAAHPNVLHTRGRVALRRGPLVYAFEQADNAVPLQRVVLPRNAKFETPFDADLAGGVVRITANGLARPETSWEGRLYQPIDGGRLTPVKLSAVPYAIWGNRGPGEMIVWIDAEP